MKRLFILLVAMVLVLSGTACSKPQVSVTEHKGSITSSSSKASTPSKAEVVHTQLLTEKLTKSTLYQEAVLNSNAVIRYNGVTGDLDESTGYALTVKNLADGSFRYLSLQKIEGEK